MKKFILIFVLSISITSILNAQSMKFGVELGGSFTNLEYTETFDFWHPEITSSINIMVFSEFNYSTSFLQLIGIRYVQQGSNIRYEDYHEFGSLSVYVKGSHNLKQNYLSIPLRVMYTFDGNSFFLAGPEFAYLISSTYDHNQESPDPEQNTYSENITSKLNRFNVSMNIGFGFSFPILNQTFYILAQYSHGLTNNAKDEFWGRGWKTRELSFSIGYFFPI